MNIQLQKVLIQKLTAEENHFKKIVYYSIIQININEWVKDIEEII